MVSVIVTNHLKLKSNRTKYSQNSKRLWRNKSYSMRNVNELCMGKDISIHEHFFFVFDSVIEV